YAALAAQVAAMRGGLLERGFGHGETLAIHLPNLPEYAVAFHAAASAGGRVTTANPLYTAGELGHQLDDSGARFLLTAPPLLGAALAAAAEAGVEEVFVVGEDERATPLAELLAAAPVPPAAIDPAADLAALPYSSGTTGLPKGVMLSHRNLVANLIQAGEVLGVAESDTLVGCLPFFHIYGMTVIMNLGLRAGATIVTMPRFDLAEFLALIERHRVTVGFVVPPIALALAKHPAIDGADLSSLRFLMSGAAPLGPELAAAVEARLDCLVVQGYGLTETSPVTHTVPIDPARNRPGTVGPPLRATECRLVDPESGAEVGPGERGELWIRGPQVMRGYLNNAEATAATIDAEGWLHTGDIAVADEAGYYAIVDRLKELIKYKGFQVPPAELEALLLTHPAVADAAVIGVPDEEAGELPKAFVVVAAGQRLDHEELIAWVGERVAPQKRIRLVEEIEAVPKSASGKILRRELSAR
ncbi:MAG: AMP-binding protein, partial [Actinobacteria bacterium]|nr:AMP-binding protein [Actinomycetota bacterium]